MTWWRAASSARRPAAAPVPVADASGGPGPLTRPARATWRRARRAAVPHPAAVTAITAATAAIYAGFGLVQQATFRTTTYDLVIFDQAVRSYAHLRPGIAIVKGIHNGGGPHFSVLGDHWSPMLAALAPLYWLAAGPRTLLVAQGLAFAAAVPFIWLFARRLARGFAGGAAAAVVAYCAAGAYGLSWPLAEAAASGFHEVAFVPALTAAFIERMHAGRPRAGLLAAAALLLVKEDMGLLVAGFGLWLLAARSAPARRPAAVALIAGGVTATWLATFVLRPRFGGEAMYYWAYGALGRGPLPAARRLLSDPLAGAHVLVTPQVKVTTMAWLAGALLFLPLLSPICLAAAPLVAERMLASSYPAWWGLHYQYNAFIAVVLVCAAVDGGLRLSRWATRHSAPSRARAAASIASASLCCAAAVALVPVFPLGEALHPGFYRLTARDRAAAAAAAAVPGGVTVEAADSIGPHLCGRDTVLLWDWTPRWAPWVVADTGRWSFPFANVGAQAARVRLLLRSGYRVVLARDDYLVLHRGGRATPPAAPAAAPYPRQGPHVVS